MSGGIPFPPVITFKIENMNIDKIEGLKDVDITEGKASMVFCRNCKTCPAIDISKENDTVVLGGEKEGYTSFTKDQFAAFTEVVKTGLFDEYLN